MSTQEADAVGSTYQRTGGGKWEIEATRIAGGKWQAKVRRLYRSQAYPWSGVLGSYPNSADAIGAGQSMIDGMEEPERVCTPRDIDRVRLQRAQERA